MSPQPQHPTRNATQRTGAMLRRGPLRLLRRTWVKAWGGNLFSEAAEAAFWQVLSLPPLLLGLLGSLGYVAEWFGQDVIESVHDAIIEWSATAFSSSVVDDIIQPTVEDILRHGRGEILTVGFLLSLWAGSSAMSSFVDAITVAHDQYGVRNEVWQRIFALLLYMASLGLLVIGLPILALGPEVLPKLFPAAWRADIAFWVDAFYYPAIGVLIVLALASLYKLALPRKLPWHRGLPGAVLAMIVFLLSSIGLRLYISWITTTGYTYGALATPIAFLLFVFFIGLAIVIGAYFNAAIQEMWPARMTRRQRRRWRRLEMNRASAQPAPTAKPNPVPDPDPTTNPNGVPKSGVPSDDGDRPAPPAQPSAPRSRRRADAPDA
ncbi:YihY/virulence factor BrkB family protein [Actinophytocola sp.]|uniref:YihY/virulence factor BrkB family protein n=1 Tax=Actinophytocola sp. TaxID=1872138 RepID=UPI0025C6CC63|nr:YhjD/YihY/BrkB family envelope integrity protein [Actinophytocola sp.]